MALIPHGFLPRSMFEMDNWFHPTLETFDPFDELDHMVGRNMEWLQRPKFLEPIPAVPKVPEKYRICVDCPGYSPSALKTEFKNGKLVVTGKESKKDESGDFSQREFQKSYQLPTNAEPERLASFVAGGKLVIEVPLKNERVVDDLFPRIEEKNGHKSVAMNCSVPAGIDPSKVTVTCKDRDIIVKAEDKVEKPDGVSKTYYYKRCTLPENTDFTALKCHFNKDSHKLSIEAPINPQLKHSRHIPIEHHTPSTNVQTRT